MSNPRARPAEHYVSIVFDREDRVWMVDKSDVSGLYLADKSLDALIARINVALPRLIEANHGCSPADAPLHVDIPDARTIR